MLLVNVSENKQQPKHQLSPNNSISNTVLMQTSKSDHTNNLQAVHVHGSICIVTKLISLCDREGSEL